MILKTLFESVKDDLLASKDANTAYSELYDYLYDSNNEEDGYGCRITKLSSSKGTEYVISLPIHAVTSSKKPEKVLLAVGSNSGSMTKSQNGKIIILRVLPKAYDPNTMDPLDYIKYGIKFFQKSSVRQIFVHEWIHFLDSFRNPMITDIIPKSHYSDLSRDDPSYYQKYFTDDAENNALYHNLADKWLNALKELEANPDDKDDIHLIYNISGDFHKDLDKLIKSSGTVVKRFWDNVSDQQKRRLVSRLYQIYKQLF